MNDIFSKVLFIGPKNPYGGIGSVLKTYQNNIQSFNIIETYKKQYLFFNIFYFIYKLMKIKFFLILNKQIKIVHIHSASKGSFIRKVIIAMIAKSYNKKVIFHMHGGQFKEYFEHLKWSKSFFLNILNKFDLFICLTNDWRLYYEQELGLKNVMVLGNPINISPNIVKKPLNKVLNLLFLGSLNQNKGIFDLLDYLETNVYFKTQRINLSIGGTGDVDKLMNKINNSLYSNQIIFLGFIEGDLKAEAFTACDIFILPSYYEGLPVSILEAMGYAKPVIATRVGGIPSVVNNNTNGWLFKAGNFNELDPILDEIIENRFPLEQYQNNAYNIASNYSSDNILSRLSNEYTKLVN